MKTFPRVRNASQKLKADYSGFERDTWPQRTNELHKAEAVRSRDAATDAIRKRVEKSTGARWSALFELDYYNPITDHTIDPMHLLYLGIAKRMTKHYFNSGLLSKSDLSKIQVKSNAIRVPANVGRLPREIASGFTSFTADQWKNWTLVYSPLVLKDILPSEDFNIWLLFVKLVFILSRKNLRKGDLITADSFLMKFLKEVEKRYRKEFITPNMHMACHLKECIKDFSSVYAFWCFSFER